MKNYKKISLFAFFFVVTLVAVITGYFMQKEAQSRTSRSGKSAEYQVECPVEEKGLAVVDCYVQIAVRENDISVCSYFNDAGLGGWVPDCYTELAVRKQNKDICLEIADESLSQECTKKVEG
jgi:hypothetical protein